MKAFLSVLTSQDESAAEYSLAMLYDMLREDSSFYGVFEDLLKEQFGFHRLMMDVLGRRGDPKNEFISDKAAWLLSAVIGNSPRSFSENEVKAFLSATEGGACSEHG